MKITELVGAPADQQGMVKPNATMQNPNAQQMGAEENPVMAAKAKQQQKKQIQDQIAATREQLKQLQTQLAAIK